MILDGSKSDCAVFALWYKKCLIVSILGLIFLILTFFVEVCRFCFCIYVHSKYYYVCMYGMYVRTYVKFNKSTKLYNHQN